MSEITYDGKFSNLEVDKLYTKEKVSSISADQTLTTFDSGTFIFTDSSAANLILTLPDATTSGLNYRIISTAVNSSYGLTITSASTIYGVVNDFDSSPPGSTLSSSSGTSVLLKTLGLNTFTVGSRISLISNGVSYYIYEDQSGVPMIFS